MSYENEMTAHSTPVGAGDEQSSTKYLEMICLISIVWT